MRAFVLTSILAVVTASTGLANATPICDGDGCSDGSYGRCCDGLCGCMAPLVCNFELKTIGRCVSPDELPKDTGVPETAPRDTGTAIDSAIDDAAADAADATPNSDDAAPEPTAASTSDGGCSCRTGHMSALGEAGFAALALGLIAATRRRRSSSADR